RDETCLDTVVDGQVIQGCRRPDGQCGHLSPGWGCHRAYRRYWNWGNLDGATPPLPNPFNCTQWHQPCSRSAECCSDGNNLGVCWLEFGQDLDAGDEDGGTPRGHCNSIEEGGGSSWVTLPD